MAINSVPTCNVSFCISVSDLKELNSYCKKHHYTTSAGLRLCVSEFLSNKKTDKKF